MNEPASNHNFWAGLRSALDRARERREAEAPPASEKPERITPEPAPRHERAAEAVG